jgi:hypothetical protein
MKKTRRLLLATAALHAAAALEACSKEPLPGPPANPKGSHYDEGLDSGKTTSPPPSTTTEPADAGPVLPLPANPKGSHYDSGLKPKPPASSDKK